MAFDLSQLLSGTNSPGFKSFAGNALSDLGYGLTRGKNLNEGFQVATQRTAEMDPARTAEAEQRQMANKTAAFLRSQPGGAQFADAIDQGAIEGGAAYKSWLEASKGQQPIEINGQLVDPTTMKVLGDFRSPDTPKTDTHTLTSIYDENGREQKGYMNGDQFVPVGSPKATTERPEFNNAQATAAGYADRMVQADKILDDPALSAVQTDVTQRGLNGLPLIGNMLTSPEFQQAEQAQRDFINAILRRESGAAIAQSEFDSARKQYFPQPGDSPQVLEQKKRNRLNAINGVARSAGPAYEQPGSDDAPADDIDAILTGLGI